MHVCDEQQFQSKNHGIASQYSLQTRTSHRKHKHNSISIHTKPTPGHAARAVDGSSALSRGGTTTQTFDFEALISPDTSPMQTEVLEVVVKLVLAGGLRGSCSSPGNPKSSPKLSKSKLGCMIEKLFPSENRSPRFAADAGGLEQGAEGAAGRGGAGFEGLAVDACTGAISR